MNHRRHLRTVLICAVYVALHIAAELFAKGFTLVPSVLIRQTPGLAVGLLVLCGPRYAPLVFAVNLYSTLVVTVPGLPAWAVVMLPAIATASYTATAWLVRRKFGPAPIPGSRRESMALAAAAVAAPLPSALFAAVMYAIVAPQAANGHFVDFLLRWIGGIAGILTIVPVISVHVAPLFLPHRKEVRGRRTAREKAEIAAQAALLFFSVWLVHDWAPLRSYHAFFLCFVPLAWIALSHGLPGATLATLAINFGGYLAVHLTGVPEPVIIDFLLFALAIAAVGLGLGTAVTFRNRAEAALAESQARLERVLAGSRLGLWDCDLESGVVTCDSAWAEMSGYRLDEVSSRVGWWETMIHPDDRPRVEGLLQEHLAGRAPFYEAEYRFRTRDGSWKWIYSRGSVIARDADGKALRLAGTQLDLTDRKQAEIVRNNLLGIIEASSDFIGACDLEHRVTYANPALLRLRGLPDLAAARGLDTAGFQPAWAVKKVREEGIPAALERGSWIGETALLDANGAEIPVSGFIITQRDDTGRPAFFSAIARDISRQRQTEATRLENERRMLHAQKLESLGVLAGGIAHDFNNLLTVMLGNTSLAQLDLPVGTPAAGYLQHIRVAVLRATELCRQMLAYAGKGQFSATLVDLSALVEDTTHLIQVSISKKCVLKFDLQPGLPPVRVDSTQIRQIVMNLVINASDAIAERSGLIRVATGLMRADSAYLSETYLAPDLAPGDYVYLEVSDNGCGMTPEVRGRVFEPFFTTKFTGRGLGLAAVLGIVRGHKGALKVYSEPGRGSTFKLLLPAEKGVPDPAVRAPAAAGAGAPDQGTILVVDDEETVRVVAARLLESQGYQTVLAADGREAVRIFAERPDRFRAVLLDLTMPHMNGEETFRELRRVRADVPVVLMSGFSEEDSVDRFAGRDLAGFVPKPFERETLLNRLRAVLAGR